LQPGGLRGRTPRMDLSQYEMAFKVLASPHAAGKIIGRGGCEIAQLRNQLGVGCHIHGPESLFPGTGCQVAVLFGSRATIDQAFPFLVSKLVEADVEPGQLETMAVAAFTVVVVLTTNTVSAIIGTKGATIASLRHQAGCEFSADRDVFAGEQLVRVSGPLDRLPDALRLVTPFAERSGDSLTYAMQSYTAATLGPTAPPLWPAGDGGRRPLRPMLPAHASRWPAGASGDSSRWQMGLSSGATAMPKTAAFGPIRPARRPRAWGPWPQPPAKVIPGYAMRGHSDEVTPGSEAALDTGMTTGMTGELDNSTVKEEPHISAPELGVPVSVPPEDERVLEYPMTMAFPIPKDSIGRVLGRGGQCSEDIRKATGVSLQIDCGEAEGTVMLTGTLTAVHMASKLVVGRVLAEH